MSLYLGRNQVMGFRFNQNLRAHYQLIGNILLATWAISSCHWGILTNTIADDLIKGVHDEFRVVIQSHFPQAWNRNIDVIEKFTQLHISSRLTFAISTGFLTRLNSLEVHDAESTCYSSLEQVLVHMHRDWSEAASNNKIITKITKYLMNHAIDSNLNRILVPGSPVSEGMSSESKQTNALEWWLLLSSRWCRRSSWTQHSLFTRMPSETIGVYTRVWRPPLSPLILLTSRAGEMLCNVR